MRETLASVFVTRDSTNIEEKSVRCYSLDSRESSNNATTQAIRRKDFATSKIMNKWIETIEPRFGYYIAGFTDGEGSFNVSLKHRKDYQDDWKLTASFNISQKDRVILALIKKQLGCGTLRERRDGVVYYEVTNVQALQEKIVPFFERFGFLSAAKKKNFSIWKKIVRIMYDKSHLRPDGFQEVLLLRESLNEGRGRTRKYKLSDVLDSKESSETIRKTEHDKRA